MTNKIKISYEDIIYEDIIKPVGKFTGYLGNLLVSTCTFPRSIRKLNNMKDTEEFGSVVTTIAGIPFGLTSVFYSVCNLPRFINDIPPFITNPSNGLNERTAVYFALTAVPTTINICSGLYEIWRHVRDKDEKQSLKQKL